jgi:hypothetical protein
MYAGCVLLAFVFLHAVGYPVRFASVAWPPAWHEIRESRAVYFFQRAEAALRANRTGEALLYLAQSYQLDPHSYMTGRILAQLWQTSTNDVSSQIYSKLMAEHPAQRAETAHAWYLSLLARGDFKSIEALAWEMMNSQQAETGAWLNAFMIASRRTGDTKFLEKASMAPALPPIAKQACAWELMARRKPPEEVRRAFTAPIRANAGAYLFYYRIDWLIREGFAGDALLQLDREKDQVSEPDRFRLGLDAYAAMGWQSILQDQAGQLLSTRPVNPLFLELLCAHLIRFPNAAVLSQVAEAFGGGPPSPADQRLDAHISLYCAAGAMGDWKRLQAAETAMKAISGGRIAALDALEHYFRTKGRSGPIERYLPALPSLPVDVMYALYAYSDSHPPGIQFIPGEGRRTPSGG